jgi:trigger factor
MNITKENIDAVNAVVKLQISDSDYKPLVEKSLNDYRKKAVIKGFRPGKVPMGMIQKLYGTSVKAEEVDKLVSETLSKFLTDEKLNLLGQPLPSKLQQPIDLESSSDFEFLFDIGLSPEFELELNQNVTIPYYTILVDGELVQKQIENYSGQYGKSEQNDAITEKSYIKADLAQLNEKNEPAENGIHVEGTYLSIDLIKDGEIQKQFIGSKKGEVFSFDVKKAYPNDSEIAGMLKIEKDKVAEMFPMFQITVNEINTFVPAEVNQDLFDKVFGKDTCSTEEEFKEKVKADIQKSFVEDSEYRFKSDAKEILIQKINPAFPDDFLKRWLKVTDKENKITDEVIENEYPHFIKTMKWQLLQEKVGKIANIKIEREDAIEQSKKDTITQFRQYGLPLNSLTDEQLTSFAEKNLEREDDYRRIIEKVLENKVIAYIKENVKLDEKELSVDDFKKLYEKED